MSEETKNYTRIKFINCALEYTWTICEFSDIKSQLEAIEDEWGHFEPNFEPEYGRPRISITLLQLTDDEYEAFVKQMEENA